MDLSQKLEAVRKAVRDANQTDLAIETGLHPNTLRLTRNPGWNPRAKTLIKIDDALRDE